MKRSPDRIAGGYATARSHSRGEGNPFFTEELLKSAVEAKSGEVRTRKPRELPQTVRATLLERLRPFDERERRIVTQPR